MPVQASEAAKIERGETPAVSAKPEKQKPAASVSEQKKDTQYTVCHPILRGEANVAFYLGEEEVQITIKDGKAVLPMDARGTEILKLLTGEGWQDITFYALESKNPKAEPQRAIAFWEFMHPEHTNDDRKNGSLHILSDEMDDIGSYKSVAVKIEDGIVRVFDPKHYSQLIAERFPLVRVVYADEADAKKYSSANRVTR